MARARWRQRSDGVYQIGKQGRRRLHRAALALGTVILAGAMILAVASAAAVYLVIGAPFLVAAAVGYLVLLRRRWQVDRRSAPSAAVLTLGRRKAPMAAAARDAGA